jgi:O-antigen ligase
MSAAQTIATGSLPVSPGSLPAAPSAGRNRLGRARAAVARVPKADLLIYAISGVALSYVWRVHQIVPLLGPLQFPTLISLLALWLFVSDVDPRRKVRKLKHPITRIVLFICVLTVLSVPTSIHDGASFRFLVDDLWKNILLMVVLAGSVRCFRDIERLAFAMLIGGVIFTQHAYFNGYIGWDGRLAGMPYYDPNDAGMVVVGMLPLSLYFVTRGKSIAVKILALISLPLFLQVTILTGSRGAFLGMISLALYFLLGFTSVKWVTRAAVIGAAVAGLMAVGSEQYWETMNTLLHPSQDYNWSGQSDTGRMEVWKRGMGYMRGRPLTGVGVNAFQMAEGTLSPQAQLQDYGVGFKWSTAHNSFVQIGAELGVFGLIAFTLLQFVCFFTARTAFKRRRRAREPASDGEALGQAFAGVVVIYVVCGFFLSQAYGAFSFAMYGLVAGLAKASVLEGVAQDAVGSVRRIARRRPLAMQPAPATRQLQAR